MKKIIIIIIILLMALEGALAQEINKISTAPKTSEVLVGDTFDIKVMISGIDITGVEFKLLFNKDLITAKDVKIGPFLQSAGTVLTIPSPIGSINNTVGEINLVSALTSGFASGTDVMATITFKAKSPGTSELEFRDVTLTDETLKPVSGVSVASGYVNVTTKITKTNITNITNNSNNLPVADAGSNKLVNKGAAVQFNGGNSIDSDGKIISYLWDFGDEDTDTGIAPTHSYIDAGDYTVTLTVTDDDGAKDNDTIIVTVVTSDTSADKTTTEGKPQSTNAIQSVGVIPHSQSPSKNATSAKIEAKNEIDKTTKEDESVSKEYTESESENTDESDDKFPLILLLSANLIIILILILLIIQRKYFK